MYYPHTMRRIVIIIAALAVFASCARRASEIRETTEASESPASGASSRSSEERLSSGQASSAQPKPDTEAARILAQLTPRQKIGQTLSLAIYGYEGQYALDIFLREYQPGLIFYLGNAINSIEVMRRTNTHIRAVFRAASLPLEPIIALDQEGGVVARLSRNVAHFPSAMAMAASGDADLVFRAGAAIGRQVRRAGCTMVYAPCMDLNLAAENPVIGTRAFSDNRDLVLRYGRAFSKGLKEAGVLAVAKHFPGHGRTSVDSHLALPVVAASREELLNNDFYIFKSLDEATFPAVMTAHVVYTAIDSLPATLSRKIIRDWFQRECGYGGLIMTDAVQMKALSARWSYPEIYRQALEAGCHLITTGMDSRDCRALIEACERMVVDGRLDLRLIDAAAVRVIEFKLQQQKYLQELPELAPALLAGERREDEALARTIAERALTLVQDPQGLLPIQAGVPIHLLTTSPRFLGRVQAIASEAAGHTLGIQSVVRGDLPAARSFIEQARAWKGALVFAAEQVRDTAFLASLPEDIRQDMIIVALDDPWFAHGLLQKSAYLATFSAEAISIDACARALLGLVPIRGRSPVTIE